MFSRTRIVLAAAICVALVASALEAPHLLRAPKGAPRTVDQAVNRILSDGWLTQSDRDSILRSPETVCIGLHFSLGMAIRNRFGLWGGNLALMASCRRLRADDCSGVIIKALWRKFRQQANPTLIRKLDVQFGRLEAIRIQPTSIAGRTLGDAVACVQQRVDQQTEVPPGKHSDAIQIRVVGAPDLHAPVYGLSETESESVSLRLFLDRLAFQNRCRVRNDPPVVELIFE